MRLSSVLLALGIVTMGLMGCRTRTFNASGTKDDGEPAYFVVKEGISTYFKSAPKEAAALGGNYCDLVAGKKYTYSGSAWQESKHYQFTVTNTEFDCAFRTGYVYAEHVTLGGTQTGGSSGGGVNPNSPYCQYSWEEKPGTTDYTTYDAYRGVSTQGDRPEAQTLVGSGVQGGRSLCQKAQALRHCFQRAVMDSGESSAVRFREWAAARGINPMLALMAKTERETKMGTLKDSCYRGSCNGIGIGQIITAIDSSGRIMSDSDSRWSGITFNILTNLAYSVRVVAEKTSYSNSLYTLAYNYNGSSGASAYASAVVDYYERLKGCGL
jgi:hypothetical protein